MDLLDKMATYVRVVEAGSFSRAAAQLRISTGAVSRQIAALEESLHAPLLMRTTRRQAVTPVGSDYYERCRRILRDVDDAQVIAHDEPEGLLRITAPVTFGLARVAPHVRSLLVAHPGMRVDLRLEDRLIDLALEGVDVAIRAGAAPPESTGIVAHSLTEFERVLVAAPSYLRKHPVPTTPEAIAQHEVVGFLSAQGTDTMTVEDGARTVTVRVEPRVRSNALHALAALAVDGAGIALLPEWIVRAALAAGELRRVLPAWRGRPVAVVALHRVEQRGAPRVRALLAHLRSAYTGDDVLRPAAPSRESARQSRRRRR